jgi:hypothetical protein
MSAGTVATVGRRSWSRWVAWDKGVIVLLIATVVVGAVLNPNFGGTSNLGFVIQDIGEVFLISPWRRPRRCPGA